MSSLKPASGTQVMWLVLRHKDCKVLGPQVALLGTVFSCRVKILSSFNSDKVFGWIQQAETETTPRI